MELPRPPIVLTPSLLSLTLAVAAVAAWPAAAAPAGAGLPPEVEALIGAPRMMGRNVSAISPDGRWISFAAESPRKRADLRQPESEFFTASGVAIWMAGRDVYRVDTTSGETTAVAPAPGSSWGPAWSPDSRRLAFYSDRDGTVGLWVAELGGGPRRVSPAVVRVVRDWELPQWSADGTRILFKTLPAGVTLETSARSRDQPQRARSGQVSARWFTVPPEPEDGESGKADRTARLGGRSMWLGDLVWVDVANGRSTVLASDVDGSGYVLSPDRRRLAYVATTAERVASSAVPLKVLRIVDAATGERVAELDGLHLDYDSGFAWSPDSRRIAVFDCGYGTVPAGSDRNRLLFLDVESGATRELEPPPEVAAAVEERSLLPPSWGPGGAVWIVTPRALWRWSDDGLAAVATPPSGTWDVEATASSGRLYVDDRGAALIFAFEAESLDWGFDRVRLGDGAVLGSERGARSGVGDVALPSLAHPSGDRVFFWAATSDHPTDIWQVDSALAPRRFSELHAGFPELATAEPVTWDETGGGTGHGVLLRPPTPRPAGGWPLLVWVYGEERFSHRLNTYAITGGGPFDLQLLASQGYLVLCPETPLELGRPRASLTEQVLAAVDRLVSEGLADPRRMGIFGQSWGGYNTLSAITSTTRFRVALSAYGFANLLTEYGRMRGSDASDDVDYYERREGRMGGSIWEFPERYLESSPLLFLDRVETPLLLVHGSLDHPEQSDEVFVGLRRLGKTVVYGRYEGEHHGASSWIWANQVDLVERMLAFFERHLGPPTP